MRDPGIFVFTCLIVTLGFFNVFFLTSYITGMGENLNNQLIDLQFSNIILTPEEDKTYIDNADQTMDKIRRIPGVIGVTKRLKLGATLQTVNGDNTVAPWYLNGIDPDEEIFVTTLQDHFLDGSYLGENEDDKIMLGSEMVGKADGLILPIEDSLGSDVGDDIFVTYGTGMRKKYELKGIIGAKDLYSIISAYITFEEAERILGVKDKASLILVKTPSGKEDEYVRKIQELGVGETILTWHDKAMTTAAVTGSFDIINNIFKIVGLFIVFITIMIIIYINILNSKRSIGIFRAIGLKKSTVVFSYLGMSFLYALMGVIFGSVIIFSLFNYLSINPIEGPIGAMFPVFDPFVYVLSIIAVMLSALVGAFIPSLAVAQKNIIDLISGR
ncbi:MAG: ABC transporter permease [Candidatus Nanoarchaeia archaeon]